MDALNPWDFVKEFKIDFSKNKLSIVGPISREKMHIIPFTLNNNILKCKNFELELNVEESKLGKIEKSGKYSYGDSIVFAQQILFRLGIKTCYIADYNLNPTYYLQFGFYLVKNRKVIATRIQDLLIILYKIGWKDFEMDGLDEEVKILHYSNKNYQHFPSPYFYICERKECLSKWMGILKENHPGYKEFIEYCGLIFDSILVNPVITLQDVNGL